MNQLTSTESAPRPSERPAVNGLAGARLLIVDDEQAQLHALCDTLDAQGFATRGCLSAREALQALRPDLFDLLLTDLKMPDMDGISLAKAARAIDPTLDTIVMTGHGSIDTAVRAMQDGALDYVQKPFKLNTLLPVIMRALDLRRLRRENALLQELERQRSAELAAAYRDLESFSYSISHDLRAPLRAMYSFSEILGQEFGAALGEKGLRITTIIHDGAQHMDRLITGLLDFSRAARQPFDRALVDMQALAVAAAAEATAAHEGTEPEISIDDLPCVPGDPTVLQQVWANLIGNAVKYSARRPQPRIRVSARIEAHEAIYRVEDNGAGFDMRYAAKLFGVFQRLHGEAEFAGTGVGLAIVQRIVARHGGRIWAHGAPDEGARFEFALPIGADETVDAV